MEARIVVVEDNHAVRTALKELLVKHGFDVYLADDGFSALNLIDNIQPSLVITDVMMRGMDGYEFVQKLRKKSKTAAIPVIMLTAKADLQSKLKGLELGANTYLTKPFEFKELYLKINNFLEMRDNIEANALRNNTIDSLTDKKSFLRTVHLIVEENLNTKHFRIQDLADGMNMSISSLQRKVKQYTTSSVSDYVKNYKLTKARQFVKSGYGNLSEIASKCGFTSLSYFSYVYKQKFGIPPSKDGLKSDKF
ncbi:MAG: response regulator [Bacteroidota bacterium]